LRMKELLIGTQAGTQRFCFLRHDALGALKAITERVSGFPRTYPSSDSSTFGCQPIFGDTAYDGGPSRMVHERSAVASARTGSRRSGVRLHISMKPGS
jgi:hypothetical protein